MGTAAKRILAARRRAWAPPWLGRFPPHQGTMAPMSTGTEDALVTRARGGEREAVSILLVLAEPYVRAFIERRWSDEMRDFEAVDDLVQRTFQNAWQSLQQFRAEDWKGFRGWLYGIARNRIRYASRHYFAGRRRHRRAALPADDGDTTAARVLERLARSARSPGSMVGEQEQVARLREAIGVLSPVQQQILHLRFVELQTFEDMAPLVGKSPVALRQAASRALRFLRSLLDEEFDDRRPRTPARPSHRRANGSPGEGGRNAERSREPVSDH